RFEAREVKATKRPLAEIEGSSDARFPLAPPTPLARLTSVVVFVWGSRTNTSTSPSPSAGSRFEAEESKATRPSAEIVGWSDWPTALAPLAPLALLMRSRSSFAAEAAPASAASASARQQATTQYADLRFRWPCFIRNEDDREEMNCPS